MASEGSLGHYPLQTLGQRNAPLSPASSPFPPPSPVASGLESKLHMRSSAVGFGRYKHGHEEGAQQGRAGQDPALQTQMLVNLRPSHTADGGS